jgi:hypothetical protein
MDHIKFKTDFLPELRKHLDILEKQDPGSEMSKNVSIIQEITGGTLRVVFRNKSNFCSYVIFSYSSETPIIFVYHYHKQNCFNYDVFDANDVNLVKSVIKVIYKRLFDIGVCNNHNVDYSFKNRYLNRH